MLRFFRRLCARARHRHFARELAEELQIHRAMKEEALAKDGETDDPSWRAGREMGNVTLALEDARAVWLAPWFESIWQDVRYALRQLRRQPAFTAAALVTLTLGIGLNTGLFTVFNAVALRPWPVGHPRTLVLLRAERDARGRFSPISRDEFDFLRAHATSFSGLAAVFSGGAALDQDDERRITGTAFVTTNFFDVIGVGIERGRAFVAQDAATPTVAIISHALWKGRYNGDPAIVGRTIRVGRQAFAVIGVAAPGFTGPDSEYTRPTDVYMPPDAIAHIRPGNRFLPGRVVGRLAAGVSRARAKAEVDGLSARIRAADRLEPHAFLLTGTATIEQPSSPGGLGALALMQAAMLLVLLVACSNVGNLQLAKALGRRHEIGIRLSIGASRRRVVRQLVTESFVLALAAGGLGVVGAYALPGPLLRLLVGREVPARTLDPFARLQPDMAVLIFATCAALLAALVSGLAPAIHATRPATLLSAVERQGWRQRRAPLRTLLLGSQLAFSTVLLVAAGLLTLGIAKTLWADLDFRSHDVLVTELSASARVVDGTARGQRPHPADAFVGSLADALKDAGFTRVAIADVTPVRYNSFSMQFRLPDESSAVYRIAAQRPVSNEYFMVLGIPLVAGRLFADAAVERREAIVNETFARRNWPGRDAIGRTFIDNWAKRGDTYTVVGVVRDSHDVSLTEIRPVVHTCARPDRWSKLLVHSDPASAARIHAIGARLDGNMPVTTTKLDDYVREELRVPMLGASIAWAIGLLALALAVVGVFGVFTYVVEERRREIGIRLALGADGRQVVALVLGQARLATLGGLGVGLAVSLVVASLLRGYLFGLSPFDPTAYAAIGGLLFLASLVASYVPARRATRVDPAITLRCD